uniref:Uncharacterized protein n=1 Tax=Zea mays TaxID=4577 RepID=B6UET9_MAIZE|nr:hypothetical protein [Zea mays]
MHKLGRGSRDKVQQFMAITGARYIYFFKLFDLFGETGVQC